MTISIATIGPVYRGRAQNTIAITQHIYAIHTLIFLNHHWKLSERKKGVVCWQKNNTKIKQCHFSSSFNIFVSLRRWQSVLSLLFSFCNGSILRVNIFESQYWARHKNAIQSKRTSTSVFLLLRSIYIRMISFNLFPIQH